MHKLSVVIITKNEESNIGRCIDSVKDLAHEIIVVDSGSTDRTQEIAEQSKNVRFIQSKWMGYSKTKNFGNDQAEGDYILSLDADEALDDMSRQSVQHVLNDPQNRAYKIPRLTNYCGKWIYHCGWRPDEQLRLFPKGRARWNENVVHEKLIVDPELEIQTLDGDILHYSYSTLADHIHRINTYTSLGASQVLEKHKRLLLVRGIFRGSFAFSSNTSAKGVFLMEWKDFTFVVSQDLWFF